MFGYMSCRVWPKSGRCFYRLLDYKKTKAKPERFKGLGIAVGKKVGRIMTSNTTYIELLKMAHESLDSKDAKIAEFKEQLEAAMTFNVDVLRCLSRIASVENHNEVPAYIDMSRRCIKTIEAKQAKALKEQQ
jgi:hypothetical protein